jgi:hypothetical protein
MGAIWRLKVTADCAWAEAQAPATQKVQNSVRAVGVTERKMRQKAAPDNDIQTR